MTLHNSGVISFFCVSFSGRCLTVSMHECSKKKTPWIPFSSLVWFIYSSGKYSSVASILLKKIKLFWQYSNHNLAHTILPLFLFVICLINGEDHRKFKWWHPKTSVFKILFFFITIVVFWLFVCFKTGLPFPSSLSH